MSAVPETFRVGAWPVGGRPGDGAPIKREYRAPIKREYGVPVEREYGVPVERGFWVGTASFDNTELFRR
jgi:hypothetical protein